MHAPQTPIFVFGNPDIAMDSTPLAIIPQLTHACPHLSFQILDPNEEWDVPAHMYIIDTVVGITRVTVFEDLSQFMNAPRVTCHDFDAYANLMLLKKLGKVERVTVIGVPPTTESRTKTTEDVVNILQTYFPTTP